MKITMLRFSKKLISSVSSYMLGSFLTVWGANKIPEILMTALKSKQGFYISILPKNFYRHFGSIQRDPMPFLVLEFLIILMIISGITLYFYFHGSNNVDDKKAKGKKLGRFENLVIVTSVILGIGFFGLEYSTKNSKYIFSKGTEACIQYVAPYISYEDYLWLMSDFRAIESREDLEDLFEILAKLFNLAEEKGVRKFGDGNLEVIVRQ